MRNSNLKAFTESRSYLFWYVKKEKLENLSEEVIVEQVLQYGDLDDIRQMFEIIGLERTSVIFAKIAKKKRINLHPKTINFFNLYFQRHVPGYINTRTD